MPEQDGTSRDQLHLKKTPGPVTRWYLGFVGAALVYFFGVVRWRLTKEDLAHFRSIE